MNPWSDPPDEMTRLLSAHDPEGVAVDDLSEDDARLARLFARMRTPSAAVSQGDAHTVASIAAEIRSSASGPELRGIRRLDPRRLSTRASAIAFCAVLASGTAAAAAATGSLPDPVQRVVASALAHVNITVPHPGHGATGHTGSPGHGPAHLSSGATLAPPVGPDAAGSAEYGLCQAYSHHSTAGGEHSKSVAFANLQHAADNAGMTVAEYCKSAVHPGVAGGSATSTTLGSTPAGSKAGGSTTTTTDGPSGSETPTTTGSHAAKRQNGLHTPPASPPGQANGHDPPTSTDGATTSTTVKGHGNGNPPPKKSKSNNAGGKSYS